MNAWSLYNAFALPTLGVWIVAFLLYVFSKKTNWANSLTLVGLAIYTSYIILLWINLDRPPMRTMGETRLWYSFFLVFVGFVSHIRWKYKWLMSYSLVVAAVFVIINIAKPEIQSKNLMPALQSVWFVPHVTAYMLSYALLGAATITGFRLLFVKKDSNNADLIRFTDNIVYIGFGLLMLGMLMGAVWAKEAWGTYWSWDPKETWAFVTAAAYLVYIHLRWNDRYIRQALWILPIAFICLMITWKGVNYLPSAKNSIHVYGQE